MKLLLVDGNSILNRAFYGVKGLETSFGFATNAIFGFYNTIDKILKEDSYTHLVAAFDLKAKTFRHKEYELYKANRKKMPQELFLQLEEVKKMLKFMGFNICEVEGFEADDVLGSFCKLFSDSGIKSVIATGDRDSFQLINKDVLVRLSTNKEAIYYDEKKIFEKYGLTPQELIEVKALMGDASDNIPGVKGIGEKTALKLILQKKSVEEVFNDVKNLDVSSRVKNLLLADGAKEMCFLSKRLGTIVLDVPLEKDTDLYLKKEVEKKELIEFFKKFELNKILNNFLKENGEEEKKVVLNKLKIKEDADIFKVLEKVKKEEYLDFYLEEELFIFTKEEIFKFSSNLKKEAFLKIISSSEKKKRTTNLKQLYNFCYEENLKLENVCFSCDLAAYLLDVFEEDFSISNLSLKYSKNYGLPESFLEVVDVLESEIKNNDLNFVLEKIEIPLARVLSKMEKNGIKINKKELDEFGVYLKDEIEKLKEEIFEIVGESFNLNSTKELGFILFEKLGLKKGKKTKTGYSTDINVLEKLTKEHEVVAKIIDYRAKSKLNSTYVDGLNKLIKEDGRIYSHFNQTKTKTGRISSFNPNIQNIPVRTELGAMMRKFFTVEEGNVLIDADYSQIELRVLAALSKDEKMLKIFREGGDIHKKTAKEIFGVVTKETRERAKTINFSVIYGVSAFSLAKDIGVSIASAKEYIEGFFKGYVGVYRYFEETLKYAQEKKEVKTYFNRVRKIPELFSKNKNILEFGKRIAKNTPIQGTAADIIKIAMVKVFNRLQKEKIEAKLVLQVHDELLIEAKEEEKEKVILIVKDEMENVVDLGVPLVCNINAKKTWFEAKV